MLNHHTKTKGDIGVFKVQADLAERGWMILSPQTEHAPFDLVAYNGTQFIRVQVKYRVAVGGKISLQFKSAWVDKHGLHTVRIDKSSIDVIGIYCPDSQKCYYLNPEQHEVAVCLRLEPTRNHQRKRILWANEFMVFPPRPLSSVG